MTEHRFLEALLLLLSQRRFAEARQMAGDRLAELQQRGRVFQ